MHSLLDTLNSMPALAALLGALVTALILGLILALSMRRTRRALESRIYEGDRAIASRQSELAARVEADNRHLIESVQIIYQTVSDTSANNEERIARLVNSVSQIIETNRTTLEKLNETIEQRQDRMTRSVNEQLTSLQSSNEKRLDQMREMVDQKLQATLEKRLGESFRLVSQQLERVHQGLGEMQTLASGVGDLKRVLSGVKTRGIWGEVRLRALIEENLTVAQYIENAAVDPNAQERVEFAVVLPGKGDDSQVLLPIDSKFPQGDFERLLEASESGNKAEMDKAALALEKALVEQAKRISSKYIKPPHTTDFAIMFLPVESLYAEALRRPGLFELLQNKYRVMISGPTTFASLLSSLQMGFRTLAVEKRSVEIWRLLGSVKDEFIKFGDVLDKTRQRLEQASNELDNASVRTRAINRKLRDIEEIDGIEEE